MFSQRQKLQYSVFQCSKATSKSWKYFRILQLSALQVYLFNHNGHFLVFTSCQCLSGSIQQQISIFTTKFEHLNSGEKGNQQPFLLVALYLAEEQLNIQEDVLETMDAGGSQEWSFFSLDQLQAYEESSLQHLEINGLEECICLPDGKIIPIPRHQHFQN